MIDLDKWLQRGEDIYTDPGDQNEVIVIGNDWALYYEELESNP